VTSFAAIAENEIAPIIIEATTHLKTFIMFTLIHDPL
jgi:hypothetical protein